MRHTCNAVFVHLIWATWNRLPLITPERQERVYGAIRAKCAEHQAEVLALGGIADHVHLVVRLPMTVAIATLVGQIKGATTHLITHEETSATAATPFFKWQGAYGAFSISPRHVKVVCAYVNSQPEHHAAGTLSALMEQINER